MKVSVFISDHYKKLNKGKKIIYLDSIKSLYVPNTNDSLSRNFLFNLSTEYYYLNEFKKSLEVCNVVYNLSSEAKDSMSIAKSFSYIGDCYETNRKDSAYFFYQKAEYIYLKLNKENLVGKMFFNKAYVLFYEGNYIESEIELSKALTFLKKSSDLGLLYSANNLMGCNLEKLEDYDNALRYYSLAKELLKKLRKKEIDFDNKNNYSVTSSVNIANVYEKQQKYAKSIDELEAVLKNKTLKNTWPSDYATVIGNLGYSKMKSGSIEGVEKLLLESLSISEHYDSETNIIYKLNNLGEYYIKVKDTTKSIFFLKKSLKLANKTKEGDQIKTALELLSKIDYKNYSYYKEKYIELTDSINKVQRNNRNRYARIAYETSSVENENKVLTKKNLYIIVGSMLVVLLLIALLIYRFLKSKNRELEYRKQQQLADEEIFDLLSKHQGELIEIKEIEQNRISKELHDGVMNKIYGVRLQLGILNNSDEHEIKEKRLYYVDVLQEIEQEIRSISHDLNTDGIATHFDYLSLLHNLINQQNELYTTKFSISIDSCIEWEKISGLVKVTIYRIMQEALLNVLKYSHANVCTVSISKIAAKLQLTIEDDGCGFDVENYNKEGIGLRNIRERAEFLQAELLIDSNLNIGTKIKIVFDSNSKNT